MDANGDKKVNLAEMVQFFVKVGSDSYEEKLTGFLGNKDAITIEDLRNFYR